MRAAGPASEVVDRTDELDTADTAVKSEYTAVWAADETTVAVDYVDVDDTAAAVVDHTGEEQSKLLSGVMRSVLLRKKGSTLSCSLLDSTQDAIR